jgi:hypothetical protein
MDEGVDGLRRLGDIADHLLLRQAAAPARRLDGDCKASATVDRPGR